MKRAFVYVPAALVFFTVCSVATMLWSNAFAQDAGKGKVGAESLKWEYKFVREIPDPNQVVDTQKIETDVNLLGEEGWECVGTVSEVQELPGRRTSTNAVLIFKRPKKQR